MSKTYSGELCMVQEQSCGMSWCLFISELSGKRECLQLVERGDILKVFNKDGQVAFEGIIEPDLESVEEFARKNWKAMKMDPRYFPGILTWTQKGLHFREWSRFFFDGLKAELTKVSN